MRTYLGSVVALAVVLLPLYYTNPYFMRVIMMIGIFALLGLGLNFLFGYTGQISLGHAAFYAIGAYGSAILETKLNIPFILAWVITLVMTGVIAYLISVPILKLKGHYLAMATLAFTLIVESVLSHWVPVTGGHDGITLLTGSILGTWFSQNLYFFIIGSAIIAWWMLSNISRSSVGRAHQALRDDEDAAEALGIPVKRYKVNAFVLSAVLAALAGIWYAHLSMVITPEVFNLHVSIQILMLVVVGGMGNNFGAVLGAAFLIALPEFLYDFKDANILIYGLIVLVILIFFPKGLAGMVEAVVRLIGRLFKGNAKKGGV